jgi:RNA polymerase sigma factor (sigma-70 family)
MNHATDTALILGCRRGDEAAWEALVQRYQRLVYTVPRRAGLNEEVAAEVFQAVFTKLVEQIERIQQPERISAWLVTTARREAWRVSRRERAYQPAMPNDDDSGRDAFAGLADSALLPDEVVQRIEEQRQIRTSLDALDERCRTLLTLLYYEERPPPYTEIALRLKMPEGSIGPTRARCLKKLRRLLGDARPA